MSPTSQKVGAVGSTHAHAARAAVTQAGPGEALFGWRRPPDSQCKTSDESRRNGSGIVALQEKLLPAAPISHMSAIVTAGICAAWDRACVQVPVGEEASGIPLVAFVCPLNMQSRKLSS